MRCQCRNFAGSAKNLCVIFAQCVYIAALHCCTASERTRAACPSIRPSVCPFSLAVPGSLAASQPGLQLVASPPSCLTTHLGQIPQNEHQSKANCACNMTKAPDVRWAMCDVVWWVTAQGCWGKGERHSNACGQCDPKGAALLEIIGLRFHHSFCQFYRKWN